MTDISAKDVAALRKETGAGMMDCKKALQETGGDFDKAKDWLRERNLGQAAKRSGRGAEQGAVEVIVDQGVAVVAELTAETDFVSKGDDFQQLLAGIAEVVVEQGDSDLAAAAYGGSTIGDEVQQLAGKLGENIALGRIVRFETTDGLLDGYKHIQADRGVIGVIVELGGVDPSDARAREVAHDVALHIANSAPRWLTRDEVPDDVVAKEREVLENLTRNEGKPEQAIPKIVDGRIGGFYKENVLVEQAFVKDPKTTVGALVEGLGGGATIRRFARVKVGEE
jgi:elongation factor Ts